MASNPSTFRRSTIFLASEFVIIVLGVLAALAVDEWRAASERRALRDQLIDGLVADLTADQRDYELFVEGSDRRAAHARELLDMDPTSPAPTLQDHTETTEAIRGLALVSNLETVDITFAEMTANGTGLAIEDTALRLRISAYYGTAKKQQDMNTFNLARATRFMNALEDLGMSPFEPETIDPGTVLGNARTRALVRTQQGLGEYTGRIGRRMLDANQALLAELRKHQ
jgi:hypothetical protein